MSIRATLIDRISEAWREPATVIDGIGTSLDDLVKREATGDADSLLTLGFTDFNVTEGYEDGDGSVGYIWQLSIRCFDGGIRDHDEVFDLVVALVDYFCAEKHRRFQHNNTDYRIAIRLGRAVSSPDMSYTRFEIPLIIEPL